MGVDGECDISTRCSQPGRLRLRMLGRHQVVNAATALCALDVVSADGWRISDDSLRRGLETAVVFGRCQILREAPDRIVVLDTAHTVESACALRDTMQESLGHSRVTGIVAMSSDKAFDGFADALAPAFSEVFVTRFHSNPRAADLKELSQSWSRHGMPVRTADCVAEAFDRSNFDTICITGSTFIVGEALQTALPCAHERFRQGVGL
jgi:dihydrofolate synthase/folylpolyglutamate synthase